MDEQPKNTSAAGLEINHRKVDEALVVQVVGEIDLATAPQFRAEIMTAVGQVGACVLDLTNVTFLGSIALTTLLEAAASAEDRREPLRIVVDGNRPVIRPIQITGLDNVLRLYHTVDDALRTPDIHARRGHPLRRPD